ncbi:MAG: HEAT repeat domain-containing protein [Candidatus Aminicenantes bacterium]|nr:HEAT repeat domain-containing protein [Candidatus Aminicenantes bacterium]
MTGPKYLRREQGQPQAGIDESLREVEGILPPEVQAADAQAVTNAVLRKLDIIRDRGKKTRMIRALGHLDAAWIPSVFLELLGDPVEEVRDMAVRELARRGEWPSSAVYERLNRPPWYAKSAALRLLAERKEKEAIPHIRRLIDDPNVDVKRSAALALGAIGGQEARALLVLLARDKSSYVRTAAEQMLDRLCDFKFS